MLDPNAKTATNVEFGYFIGSIGAPSDALTDKVLNVAAISPIVDDRISTDTKFVALNNDLTIAADLTDVLSLTLMDDGLFFKREYLDDLTFANYIVDVNGKEIAYVPYGATFMENYIAYDGKAYNFKMQKVFADMSEYFPISEYDTYMILFSTDLEDGGYYHYDIRAGKLSALEYQPASSSGISTHSFGYVVSYLDDVLNTKFAIYNENNILIEDDLDAAVTYAYQIEDSYILMMSDGSYYIAK